MKIELKRLKVNLEFSEETIMFMADVYVEGKKVAYAQNNGRGAMTHYHAYSNSNRGLLRQAELYFANMPNRVLTYDYKGETKTIELEYSLQHAIDELVENSIQNV